ncbi:hypothetical protein KR009_008375 [Drosophila setifemur]|nr:hypothetical protein KR009_008375 [Drosophila setifemur]
MGNTPSATPVKTSEDSSSQESPVLCGLLSRPRLRGVLTKIQRILRHRVSISGRKQKRLSKQARASLLRPMPRCSSFGSSGNLLTPRRSNLPMGLADRNYAQWKCSFEHAGKQENRLHDISEIIAGQTTPEGFPSHTDPTKCLIPEQPVPESPLYDLVGGVKVRRRLSLRNHPLQRKPSARQKAVQAKIEEDIDRELVDLEDYYGGFHFAQRSERLVRI